MQAVAAIAGVTGNAVVPGDPIAPVGDIKIDGTTITLNDTVPTPGYVTLASVVSDIISAAIPNVTADADDNRLNIQKTGGGSLVLEDVSGIFAAFGITAAPTTYPARTYGTYWRNATSAVNSSTGRFFTDIDQQNYIAEAPIKVGSAAASGTPEFHIN